MIVGAYDSHSRGRVARELAQAILIRQSGFSVHFHEALKEVQAERGLPRRAVHFAMGEVGVSRMEQPATLGLHRDATVTAGMAE